MKSLLVATNNGGKVKEIQEILQEWNIVSLKDISVSIAIEENGKTFEENAILKVTQLYQLFKMPCIADDSGIEIEKYHGWPGVHTARFLGKEKATNAFASERNQFILEKMKGIPKEQRKVKHVTCIAYINEQGETFVFRGEEQGYITQHPRGKGGFGFDPIFELENGKTLAELTPQEKNSNSSRRIALDKIKKIIEGGKEDECN